MRRTLLITTLLAAFAVLGGGLAFGQAAPPASWSVTDCQACHDKAVGPGFNHTKHAGLDQSCAQCHQNVAEHAKGQMAGDSKAPTPSVKKLKAQEINATCLTCHEKNGQSSWLMGKHARRNVACTSCHSVHDAKSLNGQLKAKADPEICYTCHKSQRAKAMKTSHHPVREGKMTCSSCHNPHEGNRPGMLKEDTVNELCYQCHTEKRGPFLFEHAPVREDCVSCHEPHGTNHTRLTKQKLPNLCWNCHLSGSGHFGSGDNYSTEKGIQVAPPSPPGPTSGYPTMNSRFIERSCRMCHVKLHGSNHPSGAYFGR